MRKAAAAAYPRPLQYGTDDKPPPLHHKLKHHPNSHKYSFSTNIHKHTNTQRDQGVRPGQRAFRKPTPTSKRPACYRHIFYPKGRPAARGAVETMISNSFRAQSALLIAAFVVLIVPVTPLQPLERATAFIGYHEGAGLAVNGAAAASAACRDRRETCEGDASSNQCLINPYVMRRSCPISCNIDACASAGSSGLVRAVAVCRRGRGSQLGRAALFWSPLLLLGPVRHARACLAPVQTHASSGLHSNYQLHPPTHSHARHAHPP